MPTPLLILSDAPTSGTGLGRITRDLATRIADHIPEIRVGTAGYGGSYSRALPFAQYQIEMKDWVVFNLPEIWEDFAGAEKGIVMTIWDSSRLLWFSRPETCEDPRLRKFLSEAPFETWGYFPMDATGPYDKLTAVLRHTIDGFDRVLAYSAWAEAILRRTLWSKPALQSLTNLPHGIDTSVFQPRDKALARAGFGERIGARTQTGKWLTIPDDVFMVGVVATNQVRKDWGLAIQTVAELKKDRKVILWAHVDVLEKHWSLPALLNDFGLIKDAVVTNLPFTDEQMSYCYSACDVTLGIGNGEGYGYCLFESLACGTPCIHGDYGGAAEHLPEHLKVTPDSFRLEGPYNSFRTNHSHLAWKDRVDAAVKLSPYRLPEHLDWQNLWKRWEIWLREGVQ